MEGAHGPENGEPEGDDINHSQGRTRFSSLDTGLTRYAVDCTEITPQVPRTSDAPRNLNLSQDGCDPLFRTRE